MESARLVADLTVFFIQTVERIIEAVGKLGTEYDAASLEEHVREQMMALEAVCRPKGRRDVRRGEEDREEVPRHGRLAPDDRKRLRTSGIREPARHRHPCRVLWPRRTRPARRSGLSGTPATLRSSSLRSTRRAANAAPPFPS